jgi:hypothetical protein
MDSGNIIPKTAPSATTARDECDPARRDGCILTKWATGEEEGGGITLIVIWQDR